MDLNIELVDTYEGIEISAVRITDGEKELLRLGTVVGELSALEVLNLGSINGKELTLVVN